MSSNISLLNVRKAYNNFVHKLIEVVNKIAPLKIVRIKNISSEWFDREKVEKLRLRVSYLKNSNQASKYRLGNIKRGKK